MSKLLKLTGLKSYTSPAMGETVVLKGQIIRVTDKMARALEKGTKNARDADSDPIPYWSEPLLSEAGKVDIDFTIPKVKPEDEPDEDEPAADAPAAAAPRAAAKTPVRRGQR